MHLLKLSFFFKIYIVLVSETIGARSGEVSEALGAVKKKSYSESLNKDLKMEAIALTLNRELEESKKKEERVSRRNLESRREVDLFAEARKVIGLFPVKPRNILDNHQGDYTT